METNNLPKHVAIIMDGNGRWAESRNRNRTFGHKAGVEKTREIVESSAKLGIESLTLFAFSSENWSRPKDEVSYLMELFVLALKREVKMLNKNAVKLSFIGDTTQFSPKLQQSIFEAETQTCNNDGLLLNIAANYGGRWDIVNAVNQCLKAGKTKQELTESDIEANLATEGLPQLDLLIRTGGEKRISNFLIWQAAYAELYFSDKLWPDFDSVAYDKALSDYALRQRRFGQTSAQVKLKHK
ncbi:MAG: polyprenyl diphosphate synthase [Enterobacterales bacterium]|nr:polyprenyl diphosphate synthase [Enterobacterales bacterium]